MTTLDNFVSPALTQALGWTLLHSLWQGALVAGVLAGTLLLMRRHRAELRYLASGLALCVLLLLAGLTFGRYYLSARLAADAQQAAAGVIMVPAALPSAAVPTVNNSLRPGLPVPVAAAQPATGVRAEPGFWLAQTLSYFDQHLPVLVLCWLLGLLLMTLRMLGGLLYVQRLQRYRVQPLAPEWQARLAALAARAGLKRPVALLESALVQVPMVIGHLRPVILLPLGTVAGLSPACLEAILAHELAHVVRRDYLLNLVQTVAEVLFFYHPAVWFMAACLRTERENCCDDAATTLVGGGLVLARALTALAELGVRPAPVARLGMAAVGPDGSLLGRVRRLVQRRAAPTFAEGFMAACVVMAGLGLLGTAVALAAPRRVATVAAPSSQETLPLATPQPAQDEKPAPRRSRKGSTTQVVVVQPTGRNQPGTVIIEKDKKGRLTDLYVNGRQVEAASDPRAARKARKPKAATPAASTAAGSTWVWADQASSPRSFEFSTRRPRAILPLEAAPEHLDAAAVAQARASYRSQRESLRTADRALASAARAGRLSEAERTRLTEERANLREQLESLRGQEEALRRRAENIRREASGHRQEEAGLRQSAEGQLKNDLLRDGLITDLQNYSISLSAKAMTVNGVKQADAVHRRYLGRYEQLTGQKMSGSSTWMAVESGTSDGLSAVAPLPPLPPLPPTVPQPGRGLSQQERDRRQVERDRQLAERDRLLVERDRQLAERDRLRTERDKVRREQSERTKQAEDRIISELLKDGLIKDKQHFHFALTSKELVIDGQKQSDTACQKYRKLYESGVGHEIGATGSVVLSNNGSNVNRIYTNRSGAGSFMPVPPAPPAPPAAPQALRVPKPPVRINSVAWGDELRKDGLIGPNDKSYRVELNNAGFTVNGQRQPDELARKYRTLAGYTEGKAFDMNIIVEED